MSELSVKSDKSLSGLLFKVFCPTDSSTATRLDVVLSFDVLSFDDKPYVLAGFNVVVEAVFFPLEDGLKGSVS